MKEKLLFGILLIICGVMGCGENIDLEDDKTTIIEEIERELE